MPSFEDFWSTYIHCDTDYHELSIEADKWRILGQTMLLHKPGFHCSKEVPIESRIHDQYEDLRDLIPNGININEGLTDGWYSMRWYPDAENGDVDSGNEDDSAPFDITDCRAVFGDESNPIDDNLHQQLDLEDPEEEDKEENLNANLM